MTHFPCAPRFLSFVFGFLLHSTHFFHGLENQSLVDSGIANFPQTLLSGLNLPATDGRKSTIAVRDRDVSVAGWIPEIDFTHIARVDPKGKFASALGVLRIRRVYPRSQRIVKEEDMVDDNAVLLNGALLERHKSSMNVVGSETRSGKPMPR